MSDTSSTGTWDPAPASPRSDAGKTGDLVTSEPTVLEIGSAEKATTGGVADQPNTGGESVFAETAASGDLSELSKADLQERAREADVEGRSQMSKDELVEALAGGEVPEYAVVPETDPPTERSQGNPEGLKPQILNEETGHFHDLPSRKVKSPWS
jgi:hypothetical protein